MIPPGAARTLRRAAYAAGDLIRRHFEKPRRVYFKGGSPINLVTKTDVAADRLIRRTIGRAFPDHQFLTEELEPTHTGSPYTWIVDPLDGTTNFAHGFPQVGVSIGLEYSPRPARRGDPPSTRRRGARATSFLRCEERAPAGREAEGEIVLGGVYDPCRDELFWAQKGKGAYLRKGKSERRIRSSKTPDLARSLLLTGFPYDRRENDALYLGYIRAFMRRIQGIRRAGASALDLCWVACGRVDGYWEWRLKPWDVAAGKLIVEEAGGRLSDFSGRPFDIYGEQTLATNGRIHREMLRVMKRLERKD